MSQPNLVLKDGSLTQEGRDFAFRMVLSAAVETAKSVGVEPRAAARNITDAALDVAARLAEKQGE